MNWKHHKETATWTAHLDGMHYAIRPSHFDGNRPSAHRVASVVKCGDPMSRVVIARGSVSNCKAACKITAQGI